MHTLNFTQKFSTLASGRFQARVLESRNNALVQETPWTHNLILNCGLEKLAHIPWAYVFQFCAAGKGSTPTKVTTNSSASQSGNAVSRESGTFAFTATHVGKLIHWPGANVSANITGFVDDSHVTVDTSRTLASEQFVIFNVDQTTLVTPHSMCMGYETGSGLCGYSVNGSTVQMWRTYNFYMEFNPVLITELIFFDQPFSPTAFSRVLLPVPLYLHPGQYLQVSYELTVTQGPVTPVSKTAVIDGWPIAPATALTGKECIQSLGMAVVGDDGVAVPYDQSMLCNEPCTPGTNFTGPATGFPNRWKTSATASPVKMYTDSRMCPFIMRNPGTDDPRYYKRNYEVSKSQNYVIATSNGPTPNPWNFSNPALNVEDLMQPVIPPPTFNSNPEAPWNGVDPYAEFPTAPAFSGYGMSWYQWMHDFDGGTPVPVTGASAFFSEDPTAHETAGSCVDRSMGVAFSEMPLVIEPYVAGSRQIVKKATFLTNIANGAKWRTIGVGPTDTATDINTRTAAAKNNGFCFIFDQEQTKLPTHNFNAFFKYSWDRDLTSA